MRAILAAAVFSACFAASFAVELPKPHAGAPMRALTAFVGDKQRGPEKPPRSASNDSCRYAHDNECDEPDIGTGACGRGSDYSDCRYLREGERDSCQWARDGECDEPNFGSGACPQGSDRIAASVKAVAAQDPLFDQQRTQTSLPSLQTSFLASGA